MNINAEFVNPFLEAASAVFKSILNVDLRRGKLVIKENAIPSLDIAIIIGITGGVTGEVVYSMGFNMVNKIAEILAPGLTENQIKSEYKDIIGVYDVSNRGLKIMSDVVSQRVICFSGEKKV